MNAHAKITALPLVMFQPFADHGRYWGVANAGDFHGNLDDALDAVCDDYGDAWRILRTELDPETNMPIHCTDVTEEAREMLAERLRGREA